MTRLFVALFVVVVVVAIFATSFASADDCVYTDSQGNYYGNLTSMIRPTGSDYAWVNQKPLIMFDVNICHAVTKCPPAPGSAVCQSDGVTAYIPMGLATTIVFSDLGLPGELGVKVNYTQGGQCLTTLTYSSIILLVCSNSSKDNPGTITQIDGDGCEYTIQLKSVFACPTSKPSGFELGWVFVIIVAVLAVVYLIGGMVYNRVKYQATGKDLIPNIEFWMDLPSLIRDGASFAWMKTTSLCKTKEYQPV